MLEFIGGFVVVYFIFMGLARLFCGKRPKREYYIIREYEIDDEMEEELEMALNKGKDQPPEQYVELPDNVVSIKRRQRVRHD